MKRSAGGEPVLITRDGKSGAFLGVRGEGGPGTGGLFVPEMYNHSLPLTVAQILVEYAEQEISVLVVDDGSESSGLVLYHVSHMLGFRDPEDLMNRRLPVPLAVCSDAEKAWDVARGVEVGDFSTVGGFSVMYHPIGGGPEAHACDMGDATDTLLIMTYPNEDFRLLRTRDNDIELGPNGRLVNKS